ncbi:hypothetical protein PR048_003390 [Dryococelus australis]|uniref:Uncharacterized protein n=1 Tax=Dryococelus australis TaxID=614101 RepID=A0ABQ9IPE3_9NEOP|nr:hypothetical protein PR048_003390 [Dryococelus australis]
MQRQGKREIAEKTRRPAASSGTISTCKNPGATQPVIEPVRLGKERREWGSAIDVAETCSCSARVDSDGAADTGFAQQWQMFLLAAGKKATFKVTSATGAAGCGCLPHHSLKMRLAKIDGKIGKDWQGLVNIVKDWQELMESLLNTGMCVGVCGLVI